MPYALSLGIDYVQFWNMNPRMIEPFSKAYRLELKNQNLLMYIQGIYYLDALNVALGNMFRKRSQQPIEYPKEPHEFFEEKRELDEVEKQKLTGDFFRQLELMQTNFELNQKTKNQGNIVE